MLIGNRSALSKTPGRFLSGTTLSGDRNNFNEPGQNRNRFQAMDALSGGHPGGHLPPSSWVLPQKTGGMSSVNMATMALNGSASGALGFNIDGSSSITFSAAAIGELIASAIGSATISINATGEVIAVIGGTGSASFTIAAAGTPGALAWAQGVATMEVTASLVSYAKGFMTGSTDNVTALTPESVARAVWIATAADSNAVGSMGEKVNDAGSASNPWTEIIESGYTAAQILRLLVASAAGAATGLEGATPRFKSLDGTKTRIDGVYVAGERSITARDVS